jgi:hypothetical protein
MVDKTLYVSMLSVMWRPVVQRSVLFCWLFINIEQNARCEIKKSIVVCAAPPEHEQVMLETCRRR